MPWKDGFRRAPGGDFRNEPIPVSSNAWEQNSVPFLDRPRLSEEEKSEVAIIRAFSYSQAETAVREAIDLLGGVGRICKKGQKVLIKPNNVFGLDPKMQDTTHPAVVYALVKILKETGASVSIGESTGWGFDADDAFAVNQIGKAARDAGADNVFNWKKEKLIPVDVPDGRSFGTINLPKSVVDCDVFCDISKFKNNLVFDNRGMTIACKSMCGMIVELDKRLQIHRTPIDMAMGCTDVLKTIIHKYKLCLVDAIYGMEGIIHAGPTINPGLIIASHDPVAAEGVAHHIAGYHCLESPTVQVMMKAGLGTGDLSEIRVLGARLQDVLYPVQRWMPRYVQKYSNVHEYIGGGICNACIWAAMTTPPNVDPDKNTRWCREPGRWSESLWRDTTKRGWSVSAPAIRPISSRATWKKSRRPKRSSSLTIVPAATPCTRGTSAGPTRTNGCRLAWICASPRACPHAREAAFTER